MTEKQKLAESKRRWKEVPKQELDGGALTETERDASAARKKSRAVEGRRKAAKKRSDENEN